MMNTDITIITINDEPRVLDLHLAEALGMEQPRNIRSQLIARHRDELESYGEIYTKSVQSPRGRPSVAHYLNEEQSMLVCMYARGYRSVEVQRQIIRVFAAWRRGEL